MANQSSQARSKYLGAIFWFLVGCLAMLFFLEDSILFSDRGAMNQSASSGNQEFVDETEDKDDLAIPAGKVAGIAPGAFQPVPIWNGTHEKITNSPVLPPPKI